MKYLSLFSGIGGFELGIRKASESVGNTPSTRRKLLQGVQPPKTTCVGYSEIDKYADQIYQKHFGGKNYGDATKINARELPDFDLLIGGFPCQAFSVAGKRAGFNDTRGTLFFDIARICKEKQPRHLVLENVKGLLSHDQGKTFQTILGVLADLGYFVEWQVLNSKDFGVPQNRERVFIVGHLGGEPRRKVFPIGAGNQNDINQLNQPTHSNDRVYGTEGVSPTLNTAQGGRRQPKIAPTLRANHHNTADVHFVQPVLTPDRKVKRQNGRRMKTNGEPAFTVNTQDRHGIYNGARIRRLTPLECERLQGFPDGWTEGLSDTQRYKTLGNAVTVNVVAAVISKLLGDSNE